MTERIINAERVEQLIDVFGSFDANIKQIEAEFGVKVTNRDTELKIQGDVEQVDYAARAIEALLSLSAKGEEIDAQKVRYLISTSFPDRQRGQGRRDRQGRRLRHGQGPPGQGQDPRTAALSQGHFEKNTITIGVGPAGTGKTYLAVAAGRARPSAPEDGQPHHSDAPRRRGGRAARASCPATCRTRSIPTCVHSTTRCYDMLGAETYHKYLERGNIEVAPLAYMRGRTLDDSFIILDEAQNTTREQMKMFLTRLGFGSKIVITGDVTQIDLPGDKVSGLKEAIRVLDSVPDIEICHLTASDVVRHVLVQRIVAAYETSEHSTKKRARLSSRANLYKRNSR